MNPPNAKDGPIALIIDDHRIVADGVAQALQAQGLIAGSKILGGLAGLLPQTRFDAFDLAIIDFGLAGQTGLEAIAHLSRHAPELPCILMTGSALSESERSGMAGYTGLFFHKQDPVETLFDLVVQALGKSPRATPEPIRAAAQPPGLLAIDRLTSREREILRSLGRGQAIDTIASELCISPATVRKHRENMMSKLSVSSSARLVRIAVQAGLA
jgi:DNA-binding NarL/FixJ family response regulator